MTIDLDREKTILATNSPTLALGLTALLLSIPPLTKVECVSNLDTLLDNLADTRPILVILDTALAGTRTPQITQALHDLSPQSITVLLSENMVEFRELVYESRDIVFVNGTDPGHLARTIETLLHDHIVA